MLENLLVTCCRPTCNASAKNAVFDHRPAPDRSLCASCEAETRRLLTAIPVAHRAKAARYAALEADLLATSDPRKDADPRGEGRRAADRTRGFAD